MVFLNAAQWGVDATSAISYLIRSHLRALGDVDIAPFFGFKHVYEDPLEKMVIIEYE